MTHTMQTTPAQVQADVAAARAALVERTGNENTVTLGFRFGGPQSDHYATNPGLDLNAVISFYGMLEPTRAGIDSEDFPAPLKSLDKIRKPVLAYGIPHEVHVDPGAPYSCFDRSQVEFAEASALAWRRAPDYLGRTATGVA